ncbi:MAG: carbon storage regulator [Planctomycetota bacterium]
MLILTRKLGESVVIGDDIKIMFLRQILIYKKRLI